MSGVRERPFSCPLCRKPYKDPKVLACLHTFCEQCLITFVPPQSLTLSCPVCKQQSILPKEGVPGLQTNFCIRILLMDNEALNNHDQLPEVSFQDHEDTLPHSNGQRESPSDDSGRDYLLCPSHKGQRLRFFCRDCDSAVCSSCTDIEHSTHLTIRAIDAAEQHRESLRKNSLRVQEQVTSVESKIRCWEDGLKELSECRSVCLEDIQKSFGEALEKLKQRKQEVLEDLDSQFLTIRSQIQKNMESAGSEAGDAVECCRLTEKALNHHNDTEILFVQKQIGKRLQDYAETDLAKKFPPIDTSLKFDGRGLDSVDFHCLGSVAGRLERSWALSGEVIESRCVSVGKRHFLRLHLSTTYPHTTLLKAEDIHVESSSRDCVFSIEEQPDGGGRAFVIRLLLSRVGPFSLYIQIRGKHITGSPFKFYGYEDEERMVSPAPGLNGSLSTTTLESPNGFSRIPRSTTPTTRSRLSTPTRTYPSHPRTMSRRSVTLEDDLVVKMGRRGRGKGEFANPQGVASNGKGRIYATDSNNQCVSVFDHTGECKLRFGVRGRLLGQLQRPVGVAVLGNGNLAIADYDNKWVSVFDPTGKFMRRIGHGKLLGPKGLAVDKDGCLFVVDNKASAILVFEPTGKLLRKFGKRGNDEGNFAGPHFIALNSKGLAFISDFHNHQVKVFDPEGEFLFSFGSNGEGNGQFNAPTGIAIDNQDNVLVADWGNSRIQIFDKEGSFLSFVSSSMDPLYGPQGLTLTNDGHVAIADSGNHCIKLYKYA